MNDREKMLMARNLIREGKYYKARRVLDTVKSAKFKRRARRWMKKIDKINAQKIQEENRVNWFGTPTKIVLLIVGLLIIASFVLSEHIKGQRTQEMLEQWRRERNADRMVHCTTYYRTHSDAWDRCMSEGTN